jgi:hypothetical protein
VTNKAAFQATFVDQRPVKGRKQHQFIFEVPAEAANRALEILGGLPNPMDSVWVAVARLEPQKAQSPEPGETPARVRLTLAQRAGMLCGDVAFQRYLLDHGMVAELTVEQAATAMRLICGVKSRSEILPDTPAGQAFEELHAKYTIWLKHPDLVA